jgi:hypothetical protein
MLGPLRLMLLQRLLVAHRAPLQQQPLQHLQRLAPLWLSHQRQPHSQPTGPRSEY